jgi:hypothetical protein
MWEKSPSQGSSADLMRYALQPHATSRKRVAYECHPERSEGSLREILRRAAAQNDRTASPETPRSKRIWYNGIKLSLKLACRYRFSLLKLGLR